VVCCPKTANGLLKPELCVLDKTEMGVQEKPIKYLEEIRQQWRISLVIVTGDSQMHCERQLRGW
jgi:hypothetical protein